VPVSADEMNGLDQDDFLVVEKLTTVHRNNAHAVIGRVEATTLVEFKRRLLVFLGSGIRLAAIRSSRRPAPRASA